MVQSGLESLEREKDQNEDYKSEIKNLKNQVKDLTKRLLETKKPIAKNNVVK